LRYVVFSTRSSGPRLGLAAGDAIHPIEGLSSLEELLALDPAQRSAATDRRGNPVYRGEAQLHAPVRPRKNVFCIGRNYLGHAEESMRAKGEELKLPAVPTIFTKAPTSIVGPEHTLELDARVSQKYDWEAELGVVIGTRCKNVSEADALDMVFGYTCINDVSARDVQNVTTQWFKGKTLDDTCPIGPWVVGTEEIADPHKLDVTLRLNSEVKQHANTATMIFDVRRIIAYLSQGLTLEPGDVIATGTPEGVGFARTPPEFVKDGDVMTVEISHIGLLRNPVRIR
jgi:2-keto-4-pentenoate hydratase/2-oxohepta-3-ene-1,7-dioic acid hydratase in catechol pathway